MSLAIQSLKSQVQFPLDLNKTNKLVEARRNKQFLDNPYNYKTKVKESEFKGQVLKNVYA